MIKKLGISLFIILIYIFQNVYPDIVRSQEQGNNLNIQFQDKSIIMENIYSVKVAEYKPPIIINFLKKSESTYNTPEESVITQSSAMWNQDYEWWLEGWSEKSRITIKQRDEEIKRTPEDWKRRWKEILKEKFIELNYRADYFKNGKLYVLIGYKLKDKKNKYINKEEKKEQKDFESVLVFERENLKWFAVQELMEDPVFNNILTLWHSEELSIKIPKKMN